MLDHIKPYFAKINYIDAELAGQSHKLDVKLQSLCGSGFSVCCARSCQALFTKNTLRKQRWGIFLCPQIWIPQ